MRPVCGGATCHFLLLLSQVAGSRGSNVKCLPAFRSLVTWSPVGAALWEAIGGSYLRKWATMVVSGAFLPVDFLATGFSRGKKHSVASHSGCQTPLLKTMPSPQEWTVPLKL